MILETLNGLSLRVAGGRHVKLDALVANRRQPSRVLLGAPPVTETSSAHRDRLAYTLGSGRFAGMDGEIQAQRARHAKCVFVQDRRVAGLIARQIEADHALADKP